MRIRFSVSNKAFFLDASGPDWLLKVLATLELQTRSQSSPLEPRKILCSRLKSILIIFLYKQYRNNYFKPLPLENNEVECKSFKTHYSRVPNKTPNPYSSSDTFQIINSIETDYR